MKCEIDRYIFALLVLGYFHACLADPILGILTERNLYFARIIELSSTDDHLELFYHHDDPVYSLQSFTSNSRFERITLCSPSTIYTLDLRFGSEIVPWLSIDDTPCRSSLMYVHNETVLLWNWRNEIIRMDLSQMSKTILWNSTSTIGNLLWNDSMENNWIDFYLSIETTTSQSSILHCRYDRYSRISTYQTCLFLDYGYRQISTLAVDSNRLYVADRIEKTISALTFSSNDVLLTKTILPLNTSTIGDIQSMLIIDRYLIWLTASGHVRLVSLKTNQVRNLFWFNEPLRMIGLVMTTLQWPNRTNTSQTTMVTTSSFRPTTTKISSNITDHPWKITTYITSIILGFVLFLCSVLMTCLVLHYRLARIDPRRLTNLSNILQSSDNRDFISTINR